MSIITKPVEVLRDQDNVFGLNKSELAMEAKVTADSYFSDQANWDKVIVAYLTDTGSQVEFVTFDATLSSPTAIFNVSAKAREVWQVDALIIQDFDGGYLSFNRDELITANFDVDLGVIVPPAYFSNDFNTELSEFEVYTSNGSPIFGPVPTSGSITLEDDPAGKMHYTFRIHNDVGNFFGYVESNPTKQLIRVDDLITGIDINFEVVALSSPLTAAIRFIDDLNTTSLTESPDIVNITGLGNYTASISKAQLLALYPFITANVAQGVSLNFSGGIGPGSSSIEIGSIEIVAEQIPRIVLEQNMTPFVLRDGASDLGLDGQTARQTFSHNSNFQIDQAIIHLHAKQVAYSPNIRIATMKADILDTDGLTILGTSDNVEIIVYEDFITAPAFQTFNFSSPVTGLTSGGLYTLLITAVTGFTGAGTVTSFVEISYNNTNPYPNGDFRVSGPPLGDCTFRIIGSEL